jgi:predicted cytidylate kinase
MSGLTCSGKDELGRMLSKELNIMYLSKYSSDIYKKNLTEVKEYLIETAEKKYAEDFDKAIVEIAEKNSCVMTTWLGPWLVKNPTIRVWLYASLEERGRRYANREKKELSDAMEILKKKDELTINAFKDIYKIDVLDHAFFDMMLNTERLSLNECVSIISMLAIGKEKQIFR